MSRDLAANRLCTALWAKAGSVHASNVLYMLVLGQHGTVHAAMLCYCSLGPGAVHAVMLLHVLCMCYACCHATTLCMVLCTRVLGTF
jgi:hypothetical protein